MTPLAVPVSDLEVFVASCVAELEAGAGDARTRREAAASRDVITRHRGPAEEDGWAGVTPRCCLGCGFSGSGVKERPQTQDIDTCPELRAVASVYSDRPGYLTRWVPGDT